MVLTNFVNAFIVTVAGPRLIAFIHLDVLFAFDASVDATVNLVSASISFNPADLNNGRLEKKRYKRGKKKSEMLSEREKKESRDFGSLDPLP